MLSHHCYQYRHQTINKSILLIQISISITDSPAQNTSDNIPCLYIRRQLSIRNGKSNRPQMVCHHTHGNIRLFFLAIFYSAQTGNLVNNRRKHIRIIIRRLPLNSHTQTFKTHAGINMMVWQVLQTSVRLPVVLHEHQVPDFYHQRMVLIHQFPPGFQCPFYIRAQINMNFRTRTAGTHIAHLPKIILLISKENPVFRQIVHPYFTGFSVLRQTFVLIPFKHGRIQPILV